MKKSVLLAAIVALALAGCETETRFGQCVGITDDKDPTLVYRLSARNVILGIVGFEMIFPPVLVLASETYCPVAKRPVRQAGATVGATL